VQTLSSHDVTAATLIIQPLDVTQYPVKFVTLFSVTGEPFQYQLDTVIDQPTECSKDHLDGIIWLRTPPANTKFTPQVSEQMYRPVRNADTICPMRSLASINLIFRSPKPTAARPTLHQ